MFGSPHLLTTRNRGAGGDYDSVSRIEKLLTRSLAARARSRTHRPGLPSDPLSASTEDHRAAQGKVVLDHQLHHVSTVHVDHRCQIGHPADQVDQDLDVIAG